MIREMLITSLQRMLRRLDPGAEHGSFPVEELRALKTLHERSPIDLHTGILYGDARIENVGVLQLFSDCVRDTDTLVSPWKTFLRIQGAANLARYFLRSLSIDGMRAECGVFQGLTALFVCRAAHQQRGHYTGSDFHLIDSFEGFPQPQPEDFIPVKIAAGETKRAPAFQRGDATASYEAVQRLFQAFPDVRLHRGFIPEAFERLPQTRWAFVHIDVDLHQPTLDALSYFYPRMAPGGFIICDDYGSKLFPGARRGWDGYCEEHGIPFVVLDTGQSVIVK
jgi:hypothetical protein